MKKWRFKPKILILTLVVTYIFLAWVPTAHAKVDAFIVYGDNGHLYEYGYSNLLESYALHRNGKSAILFDHYLIRDMHSYHDDINGYVDYKDVLQEYAISRSKGFDLDAYTSGPDAVIAEVYKVRVVTVENGKLVFTDKVIGDPVEIALAEVNAADGAAVLREALERYSSMLELDFSQYDLLGSSSKDAVVQAVFARRGEGFADIQTVQAVFAQELADFLAEMGEAMILVNAAENPQELEDIFAQYGKAMGLEMDAYNMLLHSRQLALLGEIHADIPYASLAELMETFNEAVATMLTSYSIITFSHYDRTLTQMVDKQMTVNPQWDPDPDRVFVSAPRNQVEYYVDPTNFVPQELAESVLDIVVADTLRMRALPSTTSDTLLTLSKGETFTVEAAQKGLEGTQSGTEGYWFKITKGDIKGWVCGKYTDWVFELESGWLENEDCRWMLQFLVLSGPSGVTENALGDILQGKGILHGTQAAFYQASQEHGINEIFLTSLALHETGNGNSTLAQGILFDPEDGREPMTVYNMFGIGARDSNPNHLGAQYAYNQGWFTPELAIIGGAKFAGQSYINHATHRQDTPYKMRWNPQNPGTHQYATDIGWAFKQTKGYRNIYLSMNMYHLKFDIPIYD